MRIVRWLLLAGCGLALAPGLLAQSTVQEVVSVTVPVVRKNVALAKVEALELADQQALEQATRRLIGARAFQFTKPLLERALFENPKPFVESKRVIHEFRNETLTEYSISLEQNFYRVRLHAALEKLGLSPEVAWERPIPVELRVSPELLRGANRELIKQLTDRLNAFRVVITRVKSTESPAAKDEATHQLQIVKKTQPAAEDGSEPESAEYSLSLLSPAGGVLRKQRLVSGQQPGSEADRVLLDELVMAWPKFHKLLSATDRSDETLTLKFNGRSNPVHESQVTQQLSSVGVDVRKLNLYALSADRATYELTTDVALPKLFNSVRRSLKSGHPTPSKGTAFKLIDFARPAGPPVLEVEFFRPTVEMNAWLADLEEPYLPTRALPATSRSDAVFLLTRGHWTHDLIRTRSDTRIFKLVNPGAGVKAQLRWRRLGSSKLLPQLALARADGTILRKYRVRRRKEFSFPLKFGEHPFLFLKVSDELGEISGQDGGFQFFNYEIGVFGQAQGTSG